MNPPLSYPEALRQVLQRCSALAAERVPLTELSGRVLAADILACADEPPRAKSAMDGFALRSADTTGSAHAAGSADTTGSAHAAGSAASAGAPRVFPWREVVGAGHLAQEAVAAGAAVRIMTGAWLPDGADAVVKQEDTIPGAGNTFTLTRPLEPGENVVAQGRVLRKGQPLVTAGREVTPQALALIAGQGLTQAPVVRRPRVALLALGDELVLPGTPLQPGQLYVSNLYALAALSRRYGAEARSLGIAADDPQQITALLEGCLTPAGAPAAAHHCDVVITLGGSREGDFDFADAVLARLGAALHFRRSRINMGGSTLFATRGGGAAGGAPPTVFFGLPGSPMAAWLAFEVLVRPALCALGGRASERPRFRARLAEPLRLRPNVTHYVPARMDTAPSADDRLPTVTALTRATPVALPAGVLANALIVVEEGGSGGERPYPQEAGTLGPDTLEAGAVVTVEWLGEA